MQQLTKKQLTEIANRILADNISFDSTPLRHLKGTVRQMLIEAMQLALAAAQDGLRPAQSDGE